MNRLEEIKNVILFGSAIPGYFHNDEELKAIKEADYNYCDYFCLACNENKYNKYVLSKSGVRYNIKDGMLNIKDSVYNVAFSLSRENTKDTVIFQGQNNAGSNMAYCGLISAFEQLGFLIINPIKSIEIASNKFLSSSLLSVHGIPQPNYVVVAKSDLFDNDGNVKDTFFPYLHSIYSNQPNINNETTEYKYVVKTLDGSLGIGVFLCDESEILSIMQTMFTIDEKVYLIVQEYKNNTGDIRAHVFSYDRTNYEIVAAMKRNKIKGDFRSNVSLGATTSQIDLTDEQRKIILDTAKASGCYWVGVDLMDCEDEVGNHENVVIEYNSSPGVEGISQQIKKNMFSVIFDKINSNLKPRGKENVEEAKINETVQVDKSVVTEESKYCFDNILLFTGPKDDAQVLLKEIADKSNINLYKFDPKTVKYELDENIKITDGQTKVEIDGSKVSAKNTIVFSRVMPDVADEMQPLYSKLVEKKFLFFNPKRGVEIAGDKFKTAELFKKHKISQPKYTLVNAKDVVKEDVKLFGKLKDIYEDAEKDKAHKYVVKNPTGGQGIGVFCVDGTQILPVLQAYFDVAPDKELLVQEFMDADGGDFRVHVLNLKSGAHVLAAMKRDKIDGDFRSNVSLGAKTEEVKLTKEQEQLAIDAAQAMGLNWVGVDIMPVKNGKDVVIECNSGAGVAGISNMLGKNLFNVMFEKITKDDLGQ